jgi:hypothetical protein
MNEHTDIPPQLSVLREKLDTVDGVRAEFASDSEVVVEFKGRRIGNWVPDGGNLTGAFACEAALLCADTADEAYRLTIGRLA